MSIALLLVALSPAHAAVCSQSCSTEFVDRCVNFNGGGCTGYTNCRGEIDAGQGPIMGSGCTTGCDDTAEMAAVCPDGGGDDSGGGSNGGGDGTTETPIELPTVPTLCSAANQGACDCSGDAEYSTYTWWMTPNGRADEQRCFTLYKPTAAATPAPLLIHMQCYAEDRISGMITPDLEAAAQRYQFAVLLLSSPHGAWEFGNDGVVNDAYPWPCDEADSSDIIYLTAVFDWLQASAGALQLDETRVFTEGFSQNSMFAVYAGLCFNQRIVGTWQGGSGLALTGQEPHTPGKQAQCTASSYEAHGSNCVTLDPCTECQYWPIYPLPTSPPLIDCIASYTDDFLHGSSEPMYDAMVLNQHDARLFAFTPGSRSGHQNPANEFSWIVGCLGLWPTCDATCEAKFDACMASASSSGDIAFHGCIDEAFASADCSAAVPCAPTLAMLSQSEAPETVQLSEGTFGRDATATGSPVASPTGSPVASPTDVPTPAAGLAASSVTTTPASARTSLALAVFVACVVACPQS